MIGIIMLAGLTIYGAVLLGLGISGFVHEHELATSGVPAVARVTATSGYGKNTIQVTYQVDGRAVQGTVGAEPSSVYQGESSPWSMTPAARGWSAWPATWATPLPRGPRRSSGRFSSCWSR